MVAWIWAYWLAWLVGVPVAYRCFRRAARLWRGEKRAQALDRAVAWELRDVDMDAELRKLLDR